MFNLQPPDGMIKYISTIILNIGFYVVWDNVVYNWKSWFLLKLFKIYDD